jgi:6-phosphogluconolactonase/glucosamine-6-phosphate isomerase/deaminase
MIRICLSSGSPTDLLALTVLRFFIVDERFVPFTFDKLTYGNHQSKYFDNTFLNFF